MKTQFSSDNDLPLKRIVQVFYMIIVVKSVFNNNIKYYLQIFLDM